MIWQCNNPVAPNTEAQKSVTVAQGFKEAFIIQLTLNCPVTFRLSKFLSAFFLIKQRSEIFIYDDKCDFYLTSSSSAVVGWSTKTGR